MDHPGVESPPTDAQAVDAQAVDTQAVDAKAVDAQAENERLRVRIAALEAELVEVQARTNAAVAHWQERAYWLDRWHVDLNALMKRPGAAEFRALLRAVRSVGRAYKRLRRNRKSP